MERKSVLISEVLTDADRLEGGDGNINCLAKSIEKIGLINPITVREAYIGEYLYKAVAGRRRLLAVKKLGWKKIDAVVYSEDENVFDNEVSLAENVIRLNLHPLDEGANYKELLRAGKNVEELSKTFDRSVSHIYHRIKLTDLTEDFKAFFKEGGMTITQAAQIASLPYEVQKKVYEEVMRYNHAGLHDLKYIIKRCARNVLDFPCKHCESCKKRTRYADNNLFPELDNADDFCFDYKCYRYEKEFFYLNRIREFFNVDADIELLVLSGVEEDYVKPLNRLFEFKLDVFLYGDYEVLDKGVDFSALPEEIKEAPIFWLDIKTGKKRRVVKKEDYRKFFFKERKPNELERAVIGFLPPEQREAAEEQAKKGALHDIFTVEEAEKQAFSLLLKEEYVRDRALFRMRKSFLTIFTRLFDEFILKNAFKALTGFDLTDLERDTNDLCFAYFDYLELFFFSFAFDYFFRANYKKFSERLKNLGLNVEQGEALTARMLSEKLLSEMTAPENKDAEDEDNKTGAPELSGNTGQLERPCSLLSEMTILENGETEKEEDEDGDFEELIAAEEEVKPFCGVSFRSGNKEAEVFRI